MSHVGERRRGPGQGHPDAVDEHESLTTPRERRARAFDLFARAFAELAAAERETEAPTAMPAPEPDGLLSKKQLAKRLDVSTATIDRLTREGMPIAAHVGDARRFDLDACRAWLGARGKRPTTPRTEPKIDVDDVIDGAGLRLAKGGGR